MLPRRNRVVPRGELVAVVRRGALVRGGGVTLRILATRRQESRFAFVVSTKVAKKATVRNRLRRQMQEQVRRLLPRLPSGYDVVVSVQPGRGVSSATVAATLIRLLQRARFLAPHANLASKSL